MKIGQEGNREGKYRQKKREITWFGFDWERAEVLLIEQAIQTTGNPNKSEFIRKAAVVYARKILQLDDSAED